MKNWFQKFLEKIGDANKENFGNKKMDCCDLNQKNNKSKGQKVKD